MRQKIDISYPLFKIVAEGIMSSPEFGEGRFSPALIIDVKDKVEISELFTLHKSTLPGDTLLSWAFPSTFFKPKSIYINLTFSKPMDVVFGIEFILSKHYSLIDGIIQSRAFYLQAGQPGDKVSTSETDRILVEVPNMDFDSKWNKMILYIIENICKKQGVSRKNATLFAKEHIKKMREIWGIRRTRE